MERKQISIEPHLGKLEWAKGTYPTPWGVIEVSHEKKADGKIATKVKLPKGVNKFNYKKSLSNFYKNWIL